MKKGSLSLSINAIVVVVLAFVMLGLGLTLTRNILNQTQDTTLQVGDQIRDQILDTLREGTKKIAFPGKEVKIGSGEKTVIAFGVKNTRDTPLTYTISVEKIDGVEGSSIAPGELDSGQDAGLFFWSKGVEKTLEAGDSEVIGIQYRAESRKGSYLYKIALVDAATNTEYASTDFFVTVQ